MRPSAALLTLALAACAVAPDPTPRPPERVAPTPPPAPSPSPSAIVSATPFPAGRLTFEIDRRGTLVRFTIEERLRNRPHTVIGETSEVSGRWEVDPAEAEQARLGPITIEAGSFVTDNELRDSSIRGLILETSAYPTIVFQAIRLAGLPPTAAPGDRLVFDAEGDLTIRAVTRLVTFRIEVTVESFDRLRGEAVASLSRADYGLTIPSVPNVAEVGDRVGLRLVFVATRVP